MNDIEYSPYGWLDSEAAGRFFIENTEAKYRKVLKFLSEQVEDDEPLRMLVGLASNDSRISHRLYSELRGFLEQHEKRYHPVKESEVNPFVQGSLFGSAAP